MTVSEKNIDEAFTPVALLLLSRIVLTLHHFVCSGRRAAQQSSKLHDHRDGARRGISWAPVMPYMSHIELPKSMVGFLHPEKFIGKD